MMESVQVGIARALAFDGITVVPGDMPMIAQNTYQKLFTWLEASELSLIHICFCFCWKVRSDVWMQVF